MIPPPAVCRFGCVQLPQYGSHVAAFGEDPVSILDFPNNFVPANAVSSFAS
jgi:hypothetical protein